MAGQPAHALQDIPPALVVTAFIEIPRGPQRRSQVAPAAPPIGVQAVPVNGILPGNGVEAKLPQKFTLFQMRGERRALRFRQHRGTQQIEQMRAEKWLPRAARVKVIEPAGLFIPKLFVEGPIQSLGPLREPGGVRVVPCAGQLRQPAEVFDCQAVDGRNHVVVVVGAKLQQ